MLKEYLKIGKYVDVKWKYLIGGVIFAIFGVLLNGISVSTIVPLMDIILSGKKILLPEKFPEFLKFKLEPVILKINSFPPILLLKYLILFLIFAFLIKGIFFYLNNLFFKLFSTRILTDLREKIYKKITTFSLDFFSDKQTGEITTRIIYDVGLLNYAIESFFPHFLFPLFLVISYLFIIFTIDWKMSILAIFIFPVILLPVFNVSKKLRKLGKIIQETYGRIANVINESVFGQKIIKAYNQEKNLIKKFQKENENIYKTVISINKRVLMISPFIEFSGILASSWLIYYGGTKIISGQISSGFLFLFFFSFFSIISPLKGIMQTYATMKHTSSALPRIFYVLDFHSTVKDQGKIEFDGLKEKIEFRNVSFGYNNSKEVLRNINLTVRKGEKIGIVGYTGAGKSTLVGLLLRFYDPTKGEILIDEKNIKEFTISSLRNHIGYVPQDPVIFYGSIVENITFGEKKDERLKEVIEMVGLNKFISDLPDGYNTIVGEKGITLSGGQKQLISIARALYKNPEILIFDEATASLDSQSEKIIQSTIERIMKNKTVFIIAHRLSTIKNVDRIIFLKDGEIVEEGNHSDLYEKKGFYYQLLKLQEL